MPITVSLMRELKLKLFCSLDVLFFVVNATYFTVRQRCKNILKSKKMKIILVPTNLKITRGLKGWKCTFKNMSLSFLRFIIQFNGEGEGRAEVTKAFEA